MMMDGMDYMVWYMGIVFLLVVVALILIAAALISAALIKYSFGRKK